MGEILFKITAFFMLAVFYGCFLTKMLLQKHKGIRTDQIGKGKTGFVKAVELTMKAAAFLAPIAEILSIIFLKQVPPVSVRIAGIVIGITGDIIFIISVITMKDNWRAGVPEDDKTELVTNGIYQISRNPAFLGFDLLYIGILCMYFNRYLLVFSVFAGVMFHLQIVNVEEDYLLVTFGDEYLEYKRHINRYFGRR